MMKPPMFTTNAKVEAPFSIASRRSPYLLALLTKVVGEMEQYSQHDKREVCMGR